LVRQAGPGDGARAALDASSAIWRRMAVRLASVIGEGGVDALYARCLHLQRVAGPPGDARNAAAPPFDAVRASLEGRDRSEVLAASTAFFDAFVTLLGSLIGEALTARLLSPVWAEERPDAPPQEPLP
jgi:hypothetical protein